MNIADQIEQLQTLYTQGALTAEEFSQAKAALLDRVPAESQGAAPDELCQEVADLRLQNKLLRLDRSWEQERETYMIRDRSGSHIPTEKLSIVSGGTITLAGLIPIFMSFMGPSKLEGFLIGVPIIIGGIARGLYIHDKAKMYQQAEQRYSEYRQELSSQRAPSKLRSYEPLNFPEE